MDDSENMDFETIKNDMSNLLKNVDDFMKTQTKCSDFQSVLYEHLGHKTPPEDDSTANTTTSSDDETRRAICSGIAKADLCSVDWSLVGPVLQKLISELNQIQQLSENTASLTHRFREFIRTKSIPEFEEENTDCANMDNI